MERRSVDAQALVGRVRKKGSLVVVGTGIAAVVQTTLESVESIRQADKVFYLVNDDLTEFWIKHLNPSAETLADLYGDTTPRQRTYRAMTARIVKSVEQGLAVCAAFYGHPAVFVESSHEAIDRVRRGGYDARMLPGVSADGCLFADLGVDPGICGAQSFEATDFLLYRRRFDPTSILLLWQVGVLGVSTAAPGFCKPERLATLVARLRRDYPARHPVVLYLAALTPGDKPRIRALTLAALARADVVPLETLYIPPLRQRRADPSIAEWFSDPST